MFDIDHSPGSYTLEERKSMRNTKTLNIGNKTMTNGTISVKQYTTLPVDNIQDIATLDELLNIQMDDILREYLRKFYQPYNDELVQHLGNNWKNIFQRQWSPTENQATQQFEVPVGTYQVCRISGSRQFGVIHCQRFRFAD